MPCCSYIAASSAVSCSGLRCSSGARRRARAGSSRSGTTPTPTRRRPSRSRPPRRRPGQPAAPRRRRHPSRRNRAAATHWRPARRSPRTPPPSPGLDRAMTLVVRIAHAHRGDIYRRPADQPPLPLPFSDAWPPWPPPLGHHLDQRHPGRRFPARRFLARRFLAAGSAGSLAARAAIVAALAVP